MTDRLRRFSPEIMAELEDIDPELMVNYLLHLEKEALIAKLCDPVYLCDIDNLVHETDMTLRSYYDISKTEIDSINYMFLTYYQTHIKNNGHKS